MKNPYLAAIGAMAIAIGLTPAAGAAETTATGLDFSLAAHKSNSVVDNAAFNPSTDEEFEPLAIPAKATAAPLGSESTVDKIGTLPPPPAHPTVAVTAPPPDSGDASPLVEVPGLVETPPPAEDPELPQSAPIATPPIATPPVASPAEVPPPPLAPLSFEPTEHELPPAVAHIDKEHIPATTSTTPATSGFSASLTMLSELDSLFEGNSNSLVARAVGSAEGTRTPDGRKTRAYRGHVDPGNGAWNLGTFSYQHGADSPEEADVLQLKRLRRQAQTLRQAAADRGIRMTLLEELNGIDLANQSPRAALSRGGYIDRLEQAHTMGLVEDDAILWARTRSFLDPDTSRWNAPGLGNSVRSITNDQERRLKAIARAIVATSDQPLAPDMAALSIQPELAIEPPSKAIPSEPSLPELNADLIISLDLPPM